VQSRIKALNKMDEIDEVCSTNTTANTAAHVTHSINYAATARVTLTCSYCSKLNGQ
jgi:aspartate carbamoyltransferase regulatory subunit